MTRLKIKTSPYEEPLKERSLKQMWGIIKVIWCIIFFFNFQGRKLPPRVICFVRVACGSRNEIMSPTS